MRAIHRALYLAGYPQLGFELWWKHRCRFDPLTRWNRQQRAIFIHIPKTAGTSLYNALGMDLIPYTHVPARVMAKIYPQEFAAAYRFTFVRDPWDRMVSTYEFLRSGTEWDEQSRWAREYIGDLPFGAFVRRLGQDRMLRSAVLSYEFFFPQSYFLTDPAGHLLVDDIFRFEEIDSAFAQLARRFGVEQPLGHARRSSTRARTTDYYDRETHFIVGQIYAQDCRLLNYSSNLDISDLDVAGLGRQSTHISPT